MAGTNEKRQMLVDVDVGIDDALVILSIAAEPTAEIVAVGSSHGNCSATQAAANALRVLEIVGCDHVPVAVGVEMQPENVPYAAHVHGNDGLADLQLPPPRGHVSNESAVDQLIRLSQERQGELDLVAVGAMTNLGLALERDHEFLSRYRSIWLLATYSREPDPDDPVTVDANTHSSPEMCDRILASGATLHIVPVDTTNHAILEDDQIERLRQAETPHGQFAWQILPCYFDFYRTILGRWTARLHDPLVSAILLNRSLITASVQRPIYVEPFNDRHRAIGRDEREQHQRSLSPRKSCSVVTAADHRRYLDRLVQAMVTPMGTLHP